MEKYALIILAVLVIVFLAWPAKKKQSTPKYKKGTERQFQIAHAEGEIEVTITQGELRVRVDDVTNTHVIEYDFAEKQNEAVGQSLLYAAMDDKLRKAGIVFILKRKSDWKHVEKLKRNIRYNRLKIDVWTITNLKDKKVKVKI